LKREIIKKGGKAVGKSEGGNKLTLSGLPLLSADASVNVGQLENNTLQGNMKCEHDTVRLEQEKSIRLVAGEE